MKFKKIYQLVCEKSTRDELPTQQEVCNFLAKFYPKESENKLFNDNWGLLSKTPDKLVTKILLCTTPTIEILNLFEDENYDLLISHHDIPCGVSQIIFHSIMDEAARGHNSNFAMRIGLKNVIKNQVTVEGNLYKDMTIYELLKLIEKRGFKVNGLVWRNKKKVEDPKLQLIKSIVFCSGHGGMLISNRTLEMMKWQNTEFDLRNNLADVYVTGQLVSHPDKTPTQFKYIIELGHTSSEKPLFKWVKINLQNRWKNLQVDLAPKSIDYFCQDVYKKEAFGFE